MDVFVPNVKECMSLQRKERYKKNPEKYKQISKNYRVNNLEKAKECSRKSAKQWRQKKIQEDRFFDKDKKLKRDYDISLEDYKLMLLEQNNRCMICKKINLKETRISLAVDHNHTTNKIRGLLCALCNKALGLFQEDSTILKEAIRYLENG